MARRTLKETRVLVTGESSGIGREITLQLCKRGARVLATARRIERLLELQEQCKQLGYDLHILAGDLTQQQHREALVA
ncbi:MAG: SDR family NAD(P)-dependent oxidoreductase, partial [Pirellula sp.]